MQIISNLILCGLVIYGLFISFQVQIIAWYNMFANQTTKKKAKLCKSEDWKLHEQLFEEQLFEEPWSPSETDFDHLIREQDLFYDELRLEKKNNEDLRKEILQLKKQIRGLKKNTMKLEEDLRNQGRHQNHIIATKDEIISALENENLQLKAELDLLKKQSTQNKPLNGVAVKLPLNSRAFVRTVKPPVPTEVNNNNPSPSPSPSPAPASKIQRRSSNISDLIKSFEAAAMAEGQAAIEASRRKTIHPYYRASL